MHSSLFEGKLLNEPICDGLIATGHEITYLKDTDIDFEIGASLTCGFLIDGNAPSLTIPGYVDLRQKSHTPVLFGFGKGGCGTSKWHRGEHAMMAGFVLTAHFFDRFGDALQSEGLAALFNLLQGDYQSITLTSSPNLLRVAVANLRHEYSSEMSRLFLESNTLAFLIGVAEQAASSKRINRTLPHHHMRLVELACEKLDSDLVNPPSTLELARDVGTNITTLQKSFKSALGLTIFGYVQLRRLEVAQFLLRERAAPIGAIAGKVGFSSPAAFAAAYRRQFGYPPSTEM